KAWQDQGSRLENLPAHIFVADPPRDAHPRLKAVFLDERFDRWPQLTIAGERQRELRSSLGQPPGSLDQVQLSFLLAESSHANQMLRIRVGRETAPKVRIETATNAPDLAPFTLIDQPQQLATSERADGNHEACAADFFRQANESGFV